MTTPKLLPTKAPHLKKVRMPLAYPYPDDTLTPAGEALVKKLLAALAKKEASK